LVGRSLEEMSLDEVAELWFELAEQARRLGVLSLEPLLLEFGSLFVREAVQLAVDGTEPDLIYDILKTRIQHAILPRRKMRGVMAIEALAAIMAGDNPRIIHHKLGAIYQAELTDPEAGNWEVAVEELATRLRKTPFAQMEFGQINALFTDMGNLARREGIEALRLVIEVVDSPLLRRGLEMACDRVEMSQLIETLEGMLQEELKQTEGCHRMVIEGILALQAGKKPEEIERIAREAAE